MPYSPTTWVDGTTQGNHTTMNNLETQYTEATNSIEQDLFTPFVLNGLVCTKDGTIANQLDVTSGVAFPRQSSDSTLRRRAVSSTTFTTATPSTTYYLFLNTDGTWTWGTTSTGPTNSLAICQVTTDGSGNISTVTDKRPLGTSMFSSGTSWWMTFPFNVTVTGGLFVGAAVSGSQSELAYVSADHAFEHITPLAGATALGHAFKTWDGSAVHTPFSIGGQFANALAWVDNSGVFNSSLPGQSGDQAHFTMVQTAANGATANTIFISMSHTGGLDIYDNGGGGQILSGSATGVQVSGTLTIGNNGSATASLIGGKYAGLPTNRGGTATTAEIYTGSGTPSGDGVTTPRTGALWVGA